MIAFKSTTLPKPKHNHGVVVPGIGSIQHRRYNNFTGWMYECLGEIEDEYGNKCSFFFWETEVGITKRLGA